MSWIFGIINKKFNNIIKCPLTIQSNSLCEFSFNNVKIFVGGNSSNLFYSSKESQSGWIVCGTGLKISRSGNSVILNQDDWNKIIRTGKDDIKPVNGHYIILTWNQNELTIHSDNTGLRDIYICEAKDKIIISTRIDWIAEVEETTINFREFGSRWLLYNQLSDRSIFNGLTRIVGGKSVEINYHLCNVKYKDSFWLPDVDKEPITEKDFSDKLYAVTNLNNNDDCKISLGLSGGMDSRVLLSFLLKKDKRFWNTYTLGNPEHPDSIIAKDIAYNFGIDHQQLYSPLNSVQDCINETYDYISQTFLNNTASAVIQLRFFSLLKNRKNIVIDGGFGEIWRREFLNRLLWKGKNALLTKDIDSILSHLIINRSDIFIKEIYDEMYSGCKEQLEDLYDKLPPVRQIGVENWLDLLAVKTRLINYYSPEQSRLDNLFTSYMPFAQQDLLNDLFSIPLSLRKNGKLFIKVIENNFPELTKYSRVKSNIAHPFRMSSAQSRIWSLIRTKLKYQVYNDNKLHIFLNHMKEFILDTIYSKNVQDMSIYNYDKIKLMAEFYYKGELHWAPQLDWWLSFEILRQIITRK